MDLKNNDAEGLVIRLGLLEKIILGGASALLVFLLGWVFHNFDNRLQTQADAMQKLAMAQAVTNAQLGELSQRLSDVPGLVRQVAELKVQVDRNTQDVHDLQALRKLK